MENIARMANDIAIFHTSYPAEEGRQMLAEHINKFWPPSMRSRFLDMVTDDPSVFHPLVVESAGMVRCVHRNPIDMSGMDLTGTGG